MKRYAFLYNPAAKGGKSGHRVDYLKAAIADFEQATLFISKQDGDISSFVEEHYEEYDVFVGCGGDGTVREIAGKLINTKKQMGIIPLGTGNDLCKTLQVPTSIKSSISILKKDNSTQIDVGLCNDFIFLNTLGFGFDGLTNRYALELKKFHPLLTYAISALKAVISHTPFEVSIKEKEQTKTEKVIMITLANGRVEGGSFWIAPKSSITDGNLTMIIIDPISKWLIPFLLPFILVKKPCWVPHLNSRKVKELRLSFSDRIEIHADGEVIKNNVDEYYIRMIPNGLDVICGL